MSDSGKVEESKEAAIEDQSQLDNDKTEITLTGTEEIIVQSKEEGKNATEDELIGEGKSSSHKTNNVQGEQESIEKNQQEVGNERQKSQQEDKQQIETAKDDTNKATKESLASKVPEGKAEAVLEIEQEKGESDVTQEKEKSDKAEESKSLSSTKEGAVEVNEAELKKSDEGQTEAEAVTSPTGWTKEERDLPAPPPPIKEIESPPTQATNEDEVAKVARAFGVSSIQDSPANTNKTAPSAIDIASANNSTDNAPPQSSTSSGQTPEKKSTGIRIGKGPPPTTPASEEKPFDFNRFLDQMRHRSAGPVGEYVRSFIKGFTKKPYRVADQTKLILDFLDFISLRMRECEVWSNVSSTEFENATEAMEKLIMNRLYNYTFSPAIKREGRWSVQTDDLERDRVLKQRIRLFGWIDETHLDVPVGDHSKGFVDFAIQELLKINHYKAPRDKVICILNCCKVIFGLIRHLSTQENADNFVPILIFVVLRANPDNLISNVEYISRFRNPERLSSESGYYLSSLMGAIAFIETMDYTSLSNITQKQFEENVEDAVQRMSVQPESAEPFTPVQFDTSKEGRTFGKSEGGETSGSPSSAQMTPQGSASDSEDGARGVPISAGAAALAKDTKAFIQRTGEAARLGIGASFGGSMNALGRLFQDGLDGPRPSSSSSFGPGSGRDTPESNPGSAPNSSARARMWNLFGADEVQSQQAQVVRSTTPSTGVQNQNASGVQSRSKETRNVSTPSLNFGSWSRAMRADADSEPPTPQSEELRQGRFAPLNVPGQTTGQATMNAPLSERLARSFEARSPHTPNMPNRQGSTDPYLLDGSGGVRTPTDDGSEFGEDHRSVQEQLSATNPPGAPNRSKRSDFSNFLPSFLSEANILQTPQTQSSALPLSSGENTIDQQHFQNAHSRLNRLQAQEEDNQQQQQVAQIDRAHLDAGVETLKSIFPETDSSVCRLVLEGCDGNVQQAIDKLLEMS
ncbi:hypothetical protein L7F22_009390 [Adiantum nelumboides]|nr:hypothetical protein [Adiantum nelumboides]